MKTAQEIRAMMRGGNATIGTWLQFPSADVAEVMGASGYDWVAVDMEHGAFTRAILPDVFRAIERGGSTPFARIAQAELRPIKDALDSGAQGLVFPMIESREQLDRAISLSLYPDAGGSRGVGYSRANMYGRDFDPYRVDVAKDILLVAQIEHIRAVEQLDAILSHPRLDAIMVGPYDLSGSMGLTGQFDHPDFVAVMARINEACKLLRAGHLSIAEVAVSVGFFDQFYFSRVFKRAKGVPPSKYFATQADAAPAEPQP